MQNERFSKEFEQNFETYLASWKKFLEFPSISTDPRYAAQCTACAEWLGQQLKELGAETRLLPTQGKPVVFAHFKGEPAKPRVLYYGHYDVQPVDPENLWESPPFKPEVRDGRLYARGAQDNKGQTWYLLKAIETLRQSGELKCDLKLLIEGEEESSSLGISQALPQWGELLRADLLMVCDTGMYRAGVPAITMGLRGIVYLGVELSGPRADLHSGIHGGVIPNPAQEIASLVASLHHADGRIAVEGYYEGVAPVDPKDRELALSEPVDFALYEQMVGVPPLGGEQSFSAIERRGFRPTVEINGIYSGYSGPGTKTIIPALAGCKITSRLVTGQEPQRCLDLLIKHIEAHAPRGLNLKIVDAGVGGPAVRVSSQSKGVTLAAKVLKELGGGKLSYIWEGASIPIVASLAQLSGAEPLMVGFGLEQDNIHAPNESFSIEQFKQGYLYAANFLAEISR